MNIERQIDKVTEYLLKPSLSEKARREAFRLLQVLLSYAERN